MPIIEDYRGHEHKFQLEEHAELFSKIDKLEESIRDKYFDTDIEFTEGMKLAKKMKGQIRRMVADYKKLNTIESEGMPDDVEE